MSGEWCGGGAHPQNVEFNDTVVYNIMHTYLLFTLGISHGKTEGMRYEI